MTYLDPKKVPKPAQNSTDNNYIQDVLGNKTDYVTVPYSEGDNSVMAFLLTGYYHVHGQSWVYPVYANAVTLTSGSGAWNTGGSITEVIPASTLTTAAFDIHWINISNVSANAQYVVDIYAGGAGSEVLIGRTRGFRTSTFTTSQAKRIQIPQQPAGTRISCKLSDSSAGTITADVSFEGHYYA